MKKVEINTPFIKLDQLLKKLNIISSGGQAKYFLQGGEVFVNGEVVYERGRKLYDEDEVFIEGEMFVVHVKKTPVN